VTDTKVCSPCHHTLQCCCHHTLQCCCVVATIAQGHLAPNSIHCQFHCFLGCRISIPRQEGSQYSTSPLSSIEVGGNGWKIGMVRCDMIVPFRDSAPQTTTAVRLYRQTLTSSVIFFIHVAFIIALFRANDRCFRSVVGILHHGRETFFSFVQYRPKE
jgi:hypothetical protein